MEQSRQRQLFASDFYPGFLVRSEPKVLTLEVFSAFAELTGDNHPIHYDMAYAATTKFGRPVAHGLLLVALTALGATSLSPLIRASMIAFVEEKFSFIKPVFIDDVIVVEFECKGVSAASATNTSKVEFSVSVLNQDGTCVARGTHTYLMASQADVSASSGD